LQRFYTYMCKVWHTEDQRPKHTSTHTWGQCGAITPVLRDMVLICGVFIFRVDCAMPRKAFSTGNWEQLHVGNEHTHIYWDALSQQSMCISTCMWPQISKIIYSLHWKKRSACTKVRTSVKKTQKSICTALQGLLPTSIITSIDYDFRISLWNSHLLFYFLCMSNALCVTLFEQFTVILKRRAGSTETNIMHTAFWHGK